MSIGFAEVVFALAVSMAGAVLAQLAKSLIDRFCQSEHRNDIVFWALAISCAITAGTLLYYTARRWFLSVALSGADFRVSFSCLVGFLLLAYSMYRLKSRQYGGAVRVTVGTGKHRGREIHVRPLNTRGLASRHVRPTLAWRTFFDGIDFLLTQIKDCTRSIKPDLYVGINGPGSATACLLAGARKSTAEDVMRLPLDGDHMPVIDESSLPAQVQGRDVQRIVVVDLQVEAGTSISNVTALLRRRYGRKVDIWSAVLVAAGAKCHIKMIEELGDPNKGAFKYDAQYLPDFVAFFSSNKVNMPHGIE